MSADIFDNHPYLPDTRMPDEAERQRYWAVAVGLQEVDGLEVSPYLRELAEGYRSGRYSLAETGKLIRARYLGGGDAGGLRQESKEADLVSQRIAELLAAGSFALAPPMLSHIHAVLFQDLDVETYRPGSYKTERLVKQEDILNGDSVLYADPGMVEMSLAYLFREEAAAGRGYDLTGEALSSFARFIALIWQVHPFVEGNTRTVAVFSELYLDSLGFAVSNDPFAHHARYFRDALVRANYRNARAKVAPDMSFVTRFYDNLANDAGYPLNREDLVCTSLFDNPGLLKNIDPAHALVTKGSDMTKGS